jgi:anti-anti-sigma factor
VTARHLEADVRCGPIATVVDLHGDISSASDETLGAAYARAEACGPRPIALNFHDVDYINSSGIALIVGLLVRARKSNRALLAFGLSDHYVEIFRITRLTDFMSIFPDEELALASAKSA